jgi:uncharacterized protein (DUF2252 family)
MKHCARPGEWDLKRLATSFVVAARVNGLTDEGAMEAATICAHSYRQQLRELVTMSPLEIWYFRVTAEDLIESAPDAQSRQFREKMAARARTRVGKHIFPKITEEVDGRHRFVEQLPITTRVSDEGELALIEEGIEIYRATLSEDRRVLFDRYRLEDCAFRVVGIGSVATRCYILLLFCDDQHPLILQLKEARPSVLEPWLAPSPFDNQGQRVVVGQRLMQAASDKFLGWLRVGGEHDFYVRQLRDMKFVVPVEDFNAVQLQRYAVACGRTLARAHAKSGDAATISGYLGKGDAFDAAVGEFAVAYANQTEQDYTAFVDAVQRGRILAASEDEL